MGNEVMVSVICNAYNHEKYIRDALDGFVMQKTNFAFEVLVHDDASTDGTADIIREYEAKYPDLIKPIYQTENQYSKKIGIMKSIQYPRVHGKYIAICEGDDYWTDNQKLQKQYDLMELHSDVNICSHVARFERDGKLEEYVKPYANSRIVSTKEVIYGDGGMVATASLFFRAKIIKTSMSFFDVFPIDYALQILGSLNGGMCYLSDCMAVYRVGTVSSWTTKVRKTPKFYINHLQRVLEMLSQLNIDTHYRYRQAVEKAINKTAKKILYTKYLNKISIEAEDKVWLKYISRIEMLRLKIRCLLHNSKAILYRILGK